MAIENRIVEWMRGIYGMLTEAYLISLSNKGIYNRGLKDLEKCEEDLKLILNDDDTLTVDFGDGISVCLKQPIQESTCTCPSKSLCRHRMTAFHYCKKVCETYKVSNENKALDKDEALNKNEVRQLVELEVLTSKDMIKHFGKKTYETGLKNFEKVEGIQVAYGPMIKVIQEQLFTVYFTEKETLAHAVCSCKDKGACIHKLYAVLAYLKTVGKDNLEPIEEAFKFGEEEKACVQSIQKDIAKILDKGLSSLTEGVIKKVEHLYIKAYGCGLYTLAGELKVLASELIYYFSRNVTFSTTKTMKLLCKIYNRCEALQIHHDNPQKMAVLVGKLREESECYPSLNLIGLGAKCFLSKRKELFVTAYFYCEEIKDIVTMTTLRPMEREAVNIQVKYILQAPIVWEEQYSFLQLIQSEVAVKDGMLRAGKLSTTKKSQGMIKKQLTTEDVQHLAVVNYDYIIEKLEKEKPGYFEPPKSNHHLYFFKAETLSTFTFNPTNQRLEAIAEDAIGREIHLYIPYNSINESWIKKLEKIKENTYHYLLGYVVHKNGQLEAEVLSIVDEKERMWG